MDTFLAPIEKPKGLMMKLEEFVGAVRIRRARQRIRIRAGWPGAIRPSRTVQIAAGIGPPA